MRQRRIDVVKPSLADASGYQRNLFWHIPDKDCLVASENSHKTLIGRYRTSRTVLMHAVMELRTWMKPPIECSGTRRYQIVLRLQSDD